MKHERIIEAIDSLDNKVDHLEGFVSRIEGDSPSDLKAENMATRINPSMAKFLSGDGAEMVNRSADRVDLLHKKLSEIFEGGKDLDPEKRVDR